MLTNIYKIQCNLAKSNTRGTKEVDPNRFSEVLHVWPCKYREQDKNTLSEEMKEPDYTEGLA